MRHLLMISLTVIFSGCTTIGGKIADGVNRYCKEPQQTRFAVRAEVNSRLAEDGHSISVNCRQDDES